MTNTVKGGLWCLLAVVLLIVAATGANAQRVADKYSSKKPAELMVSVGVPLAVALFAYFQVRFHRDTPKRMAFLAVEEEVWARYEAGKLDEEPPKEGEEDGWSRYGAQAPAAKPAAGG